MHQCIANFWSTGPVHNPQNGCQMPRCPHLRVRIQRPIRSIIFVSLDLVWVWYLVTTAEHVWINMSCSSPLQPPLLLSFYPFFWDVACVLGGGRHSAKKQDTRMGKVFTSLYQTSHDCTDQRKNKKSWTPRETTHWMWKCDFTCAVSDILMRHSLTVNSMFLQNLQSFCPIFCYDPRALAVGSVL